MKRAFRPLRHWSGPVSTYWMCREVWAGYVHPTIKTQGFMIPAAERVKAAVPVPVIGVGGITEAEFADRVVREERVDMVAVGRAMLSDPSWARVAVGLLSD